jgi:TPR repeat protein
MDDLLKNAIHKLNQGDFSATVEVLAILGGQGNAEAQLRLGMMHAAGKGVAVNYRLAAEWLEKAAAQGQAQAQSLLGWLYANGFGVEQDDQRAGQYYLQAAQGGLAKDQYMAGTMYRWGRYGVSSDLHEMVEWYMRSAQQNFAPAQYALGKLLSEGVQVEQDLMSAFQWLSLAAANGSEAAAKTLREVMAAMTPPQLEQAKQAMLRSMAE